MSKVCTIINRKWQLFLKYFHLYASKRNYSEYQGIEDNYYVRRRRKEKHKAFKVLQIMRVKEFANTFADDGFRLSIHISLHNYSLLFTINASCKHGK